MDENQPKQEIIRNPDGTFPKGVSGNPAGGGRPAGSFSIRRMIAEKMKQDPEEAKAFIELIYERAKTNNDSKEFKYIEMIVESIDGKLTQPIEQSVNITDLSEFTAEELQAFRDMLKERKSAKSE